MALSRHGRISVDPGAFNVVFFVNDFSVQAEENVVHDIKIKRNSINFQLERSINLYIRAIYEHKRD